jgi:hypothetical protein
MHQHIQNKKGRLRKPTRQRITDTQKAKTDQGRAPELNHKPPKICEAQQDFK